ncbi:MAG: tetratricopeptide repeat protein, partial [Planctomycetota bacterium]
MSISYADLTQYLKKKNITIPDFREYLNFVEQFETLSQALKNKGISLQEYSEYLSRNSTLSEIRTVTSENYLPLKDIQASGAYLLKQKTLSLEELNKILHEFLPEHWNLPYFLQLLVKYRKIKSEELVELLNISTSPSISQNPYQMRQIEDRLEFFLKTSSEKRFGAYQILEEIGRGGMGIIYKAYHPYLNQFHALKVLISGEKASELQWKRFLREIHTIARLKHPHIIQIYDSGETEGQAYFSMEYVEGKTLEDLIREGISIRRGLKLFHQCLKALAYAHEQNILHRDLKPANILVTSNDEAKISDFGLARDLAEESTQKLTQTGIILGSPVYMAPEQITGATLDFRTDIYAMGVCLFQLLTGTLPFKGKSLNQLKYKILKNESTPPSHLRPEVHRNLDAVVLKALEKKPENRYVSASEFAMDVERFLQGKPPLYAISPTASQQLFRWFKQNRKISKSVFFFLFFFLALLGFSFLSRSRIQQQQFEEVYQRMAPMLSEKNSLSKPFRSIPFYLKLLNGLNEVLQIRPASKELQQERFYVSEQLLQLSCEFRSYHLASYVIQDLPRFPLSLMQKEKMVEFQDYVETKRTLSLKKHQKRLQYWLQRFRETLVSPEEKKDALFEMSKMQEREIFEEIITLLKKEFQSLRHTSPGTEYPIAFMETFIEVLGRQGKEEAETILLQNISFLATFVKDIPEEKRPFVQIHLMIVLVEAIGNLKRTKHFKNITEIRHKMGVSSLFFRGTELAYKKLLNKLSSEDWAQVEDSNRAMMKHDQGNYSEAIEEYNRMITLYPEWGDLYNNRALCKRLLGDFEGALKDLEISIKLSPEDYAIYLNRGTLYLRMEKFDRALEDFNTGIRLNPDILEGYISRGQVLLDSTKYEEAIQNFSYVIQKNPYFPEAYHDRGLALQSLGKLSEALHDLDSAIRLNPENTNFYNTRGYIKQESGDIEGALSDFNRSIEIDPKNTSPYLNRAKIRKDLKDLEGALHDYIHIRTLEPNNVHSYIEAGLCYMEQKNYEQALTEYKKGLEYHPKNPFLLFNQGSVYHSLGRRELAFQNYNNALFYKPDLAEVYNNRGTLRRESGGDWNETMADYQKAKEIEPTNVLSYFNIGSMYQELGETTTAISWYTQALK